MAVQTRSAKKGRGARNGAAPKASPAVTTTAAALPDESSRRSLVRVCGVCGVALLALLASACSSLLPHQQLTVGTNVLLSCFGYYAVTVLIESPVVQEMFLRGGLRGIDLNKATTARDQAGALVRPIRGVAIPESQGVIAATVYIILLAVLIPVAFRFAAHGEGQFPHAQLSEYLAALLSITLGTFLGFADDVLDLRWRHKIPLPVIANLPLVLVHYASGGLTGVAVPNQLRVLFGGITFIELGKLYYLFLLGLALVSTHAINIYAGVNGLETGQSVVIAASAAARVPPA